MDTGKTQKMSVFKAKIEIIGINPYVTPPQEILQQIFDEAGKLKGAIPVRGKLNGYEFHQTLVKYSGAWRLYLNTPMRKNTGLTVGDWAEFDIRYDSDPPRTAMPPALVVALENHPDALLIFNKLSPSHQKEFKNYIASLKSEEAINRNVARVIDHLMGKVQFMGRKGPGT